MKSYPCDAELEGYYCFSPCAIRSNYSAMISAMSGNPAEDSTIGSDSLLDAIDSDRKVWRCLQALDSHSRAILAAYYIAPRTHIQLAKYGPLAAVAAIEASDQELHILIAGSPAKEVAVARKRLECVVSAAHAAFERIYTSEKKHRYSMTVRGE